MPKLPSADDFQRNTPRPQRSAVGYSAPNMTDVGTGAQAIGTELTRVGLERQKNSEDLALTRAKSAHLKQSLDLQNALENDPDYINTPKKYNAAQESIRNQLSQNLSPQNREKFFLETENMVINSGQRIYDVSKSKGRDFEIADYTTRENDNKAIAINSTDPLIIKNAKENTMRELVALADKGTIDRTEAARRVISFTTEVDKGRLSFANPKEIVNLAEPKIEGLTEKGNIDLTTRPKVVNEDGSYSTVKSTSVNIDGEEVLIPMVAKDGSRILNTEEAVKQYKDTGEFLGKFETPDAATKYGRSLSQDQSKIYGGFESVIPVIFKNEGGWAGRDGSTNAPVVYGVTRKNWPKEYEEINNIRIDQGDEAGRKAAAAFYKKEYWDKNNIDNLATDVQAVVADGMVNHRVGFANSLLEAARSGANKQELLQMRRNEYARLVATGNPDYVNAANSWETRLQNVENAVQTTNRYPKLKELYPSLNDDDFAPVLERAKEAIKREQVDISIQELTYADSAAVAGILSKNADQPAVANAYKKRQDDLEKDPAGYVLNSPEVISARQSLDAMIKNPTISEAQKATYTSVYYDTIRKKQIAMGLPEYKTRVVPASVAAEVKKILDSPSSTADQSVNAVRSVVGAYGPDGALALREGGVTGPKYIVGTMPMGSGADTLAIAIKDTLPVLEKNIPAEKMKSLAVAMTPIMDEYSRAVSRKVEGPQLAADVNESIKLLATKYISSGTEPEQAVERAYSEIVQSGIDIIDGVIVPKGYNPSDIAVLTSHGNKILEPNFKVFIPPYVAATSGDAYKKNIYRDAVVDTVGGNIVFYGPDGLALLDESLVIRDADGRATNPQEAVIKIPIQKAIDMTRLIFKGSPPFDYGTRFGQQRDSMGGYIPAMPSVQVDTPYEGDRRGYRRKDGVPE